MTNSCLELALACTLSHAFSMAGGLSAHAREHEEKKEEGTASDQEVTAKREGLVEAGVGGEEKAAAFLAEGKE